MGQRAFGWSIEHLYLMFLEFNLSQAGNTNDSNMTDSGGFVKVATDEEHKRMDQAARRSREKREAARKELEAREAAEAAGEEIPRAPWCRGQLETLPKLVDLNPGRLLLSVTIH
jgi:hypothetical protein